MSGKGTGNQTRGGKQSSDESTEGWGNGQSEDDDKWDEVEDEGSLLEENRRIEEWLVEAAVAHLAIERRLWSVDGQYDQGGVISRRHFQVCYSPELVVGQRQSGHFHY